MREATRMSLSVRRMSARRTYGQPSERARRRQIGAPLTFAALRQTFSKWRQLFL